jgi:hypothetical protein
MVATLARQAQTFETRSPIMTLHELIETIREGKYASVGSYPKYWITSDGGILSYEAIRENLKQICRCTHEMANGRKTSENRQWAIVACEVNWEDPELFCDHTGNRIESAYAEPESSVKSTLTTLADEFKSEE